MNKMTRARQEIRAEAKQKWNGNSALRAEFSYFDRYLSYRAAEACGQGKVIEGKVIGGKDHA